MYILLETLLVLNLILFCLVTITTLFSSQKYAEQSSHSTLHQQYQNIIQNNLVNLDKDTSTN